MKLDTDEDYEKLKSIAEETIDFFADNALQHERISEMIERIGLEIDPNMVVHPRESSYVRTDTWDEEAAKWFARNGKQQKSA